MLEDTTAQTDPFALYHAPLRHAAAWRRGALGLLCFVVLQMLAIVLLALRPPLVIIKDRTGQTPPQVGRFFAEPPRTVADARLFMGHILQLRYGWDSLTVARDMHAFLGSCYGSQRQQEELFLQEMVADVRNPRRKQTRLSQWQQQSINNRLVLPDDLSAYDCRHKAERRQWDCHVRAEVLTTSLSSAAKPQVGALVRQPMHFVATFLETPHTADTPYGLVVAAMHAEPQGPAHAAIETDDGKEQEITP